MQNVLLSSKKSDYQHYHYYNFKTKGAKKNKKANEELREKECGGDVWLKHTIRAFFKTQQNCFQIYSL